MEKRYKVHTGWKVKLEIVEVEKELPKSVQLPNGRVERKDRNFTLTIQTRAKHLSLQRRPLKKESRRLRIS